MRLFFILSLPRSGSTLLQRLLMAHPQVRTCGEPWMALPFALMLRPDVNFSTYGNASLLRSGDNFLRYLPGGEDFYLREAGKCIRNLYCRMAGEGNFCFVDKTPRYYKIIPELVTMFPDAKFIILKREPVSVYASILNYIKEDLHLLPTWEQDLSEGMPALSEGLDILKGQSNVVNYEDLVTDPDSVISSILNFMELPLVELGELESNLSKNRIARGDPTGVKKYNSVSNESLSGWSRTICSRTRRRIGLKWLGSIEDSVFNRLGYSKENSIQILKKCSSKFSPIDELRWGVGKFYFNNNINVLRWSIKRRIDGFTSSVY